MKTKSFNTNINKFTNDGYKVVVDDLNDRLFNQGHPSIYLEGSTQGPEDAYIALLDCLYPKLDDANGGDFICESLAVDANGKVNIQYAIYDLEFPNKTIDEVIINLEGFVLENKMNTFFLVTSLSL